MKLAGHQIYSRESREWIPITIHRAGEHSSPNKVHIGSEYMVGSQGFPVPVLRWVDKNGNEKGRFVGSFAPDAAYEENDRIEARVTDLAHIQTFYVRYNQVKELAIDLGELVNTRTIGLGSNNTEGLGHVDLSNLHDLENLDLSGAASVTEIDVSPQAPIDFYYLQGTGIGQATLDKLLQAAVDSNIYGGLMDYDGKPSSEAMENYYTLLNRDWDMPLLGTLARADAVAFEIEIFAAVAVTEDSVTTEADVLAFEIEVFNALAVTEEIAVAKVSAVAFEVEVFDAVTMTEGNVIAEANVVTLEAEVFDAVIATEKSTVAEVNAVVFEVGIFDALTATEERAVAEVDAVAFEVGIFDAVTVAEGNAIAEASAVNLEVELFNAIAVTQESTIAEADLMEITAALHDVLVMTTTEVSVDVPLTTESLTLELKDVTTLYGVDIELASLRWNGLNLTISNIHPETFNIEIFRRNGATEEEWEYIGAIKVDEGVTEYDFLDSKAEDYDTIDYRARTNIRIGSRGDTYPMQSYLHDVDVPEPAVLGEFEVRVVDKSASHISLEWGRSEGADYYETWYREQGGDWILRGTTAGTSTTLNTVTEGVTYDVYVKSVNEHGYYDSEIISTVAKDIIHANVEAGFLELIAEIQNPTTSTQIGVTAVAEQLFINLAVHDVTVEADALIEAELLAFNVALNDVSVTAGEAVFLDADLLNFQTEAFEVSVSANQSVRSEVEMLEFTAEVFNAEVATQEAVYLTPEIVEFATEVLQVSVADKMNVLCEAGLTALTTDVFGVSVFTEETVSLSLSVTEIEATVFDAEVYAEEAVYVDADLTQIAANLFDVSVLAEEAVYLTPEIAEFATAVFDVEIQAEEAVYLDADLLKVTAEIFDVSIFAEETVMLEADLLSYDVTVESVSVVAEETITIEAQALGYAIDIHSATVHATAIPDVPTGLTAPEVNETTITVQWNEVSNADLYRVRYKKSTETSWSRSPTALTSLYISDLEPDTNYQVQVRAENEYGLSKYGGILEVRTDVSTAVAPEEPTGLHVSATGHDSLTVEWDAVDNANDYRVRYKDASNSSWSYASPTVGTQYVIGDLEPDTEYQIAVEARNDYGTSGWTSFIQVRTDNAPAPAVPTGLRAEEITESSIRAAWNKVEHADVYRTRYKKASESSWTNTGMTGNLNQNITGLEADTEYHIAVEAYNSELVSSGWSSFIEVRTIGEADYSTTVDVQDVTPGRVELLISDIHADIGTIEIQRKREGEPFVELDSFSPTSDSRLWTDMSVTSGRDYVYRIDAVHSTTGNSYVTDVNVSVPEETVGAAPTSHYTFDELSGDLIDQAGSNHGAVYGSMGRSGERYEFRSNTYVEIPDNDEQSFTDGTNDVPFTIELDISFRNDPAGFQWIFSKRDAAGHEYQVMVYDGYFQVALRGGGTYIGRGVPNSNMPGSRSKVFITYDGSGTAAGLKIYVDGVRADTANTFDSSYSGMDNTAAVTTIGRLEAIGDYYFDGNLYELKVYKGYEFSATEISNA